MPLPPAYSRRRLAQRKATVVIALLSLWLVDAAQLLFLPLSTSPALDWTAAPLAVNGIYAPLVPLTFLPGVRARNSDVITFSYGAVPLFIVAVAVTVLVVRCGPGPRARHGSPPIRQPRARARAGRPSHLVRRHPRLRPQVSSNLAGVPVPRPAVCAGARLHAAAAGGPRRALGLPHQGDLGRRLTHGEARQPGHCPAAASACHTPPRRRSRALRSASRVATSPPSSYPSRCSLSP